jgi:pSer/pThr/pTyr-binding forkhead associated (FHA) protein
MGSLLLKFLLGAVAGLLAWMIWEPAYPKQFSGNNEIERYMVLTAGALIGSVVGGLTGFQRGGKRHTMMGLFFGLVFGSVGITFGYGVAGAVQGLFPHAVFIRPDIPLPIKVIARVAVLIPIGVALGAAVGASTLNARRTLQGAIGGLIAGAVSGLLFDIIGMLIGGFSLTAMGIDRGDTGGVSRALTFVMLGATVALFIGIVDRIARSAWVRLELGRNEGKEWSIDGAQTFIGRSEGAHIPLFGDPNVAPIHAVIQRQGSQYYLADGGSPVGTLLDGHRIQQAPLYHGQTIVIGSFRLLFLMKNQQAPARGPEAYQGQAYPLQPQPSPAQTAAFQTPQTPSMPTQVMSPATSMPPQAIAASYVSLVAIDGPLIGQRFPVQQPITVGRECPSIPMSFDTAASRRHASLAPAPGGVSVSDSGSTNGTFVNGQRIAQSLAQIGDLIKIGSTTFRVEAA